MVCSVFASSLRGVKQLEPAATTGLSYPWDRYGFSDSAWTALLVPAGVTILQMLLRLRVVGLVSGADATSPS